MAASSLAERLFRNFAVVLSSNTAIAILGLVTFSIVARALGIEGLGQISLIQALTLVARQLLGLDTWQAVISLGTEALERADLSRVRDVIRMGLVCDFIAGGAAFAALAFGVAYFGSAVGFSDDVRFLAGIYAASSLVCGYTSTIGALRLFDNFSLHSAIQVGISLTTAAVAIYLWLTHAGLTEYVICFAVVQGLGGGVSIWAAIRVCSHQGIDVFSGSIRAVAPQFMRIAGSTGVVQTLNTLRAQGDLLLLSAFATPHAVGLYAAAQKTAGLVNRIGDPARAALYPEVAKLAASGQFAKAKSLLLLSLAGGATLALSIIVVFFLFGPSILSAIAGPRFAEAQHTLLILAIGYSIYLACFPLISFAQAFEGSGTVLRMFSLAFILYAVASLFLIPQYGGAGAGYSQIAFSVAYLLIGLASLKALQPKPGG